MAETTTPPSAGISRAEEEASFYHEAALNASWTGVRLAVGGLSFLFGAFGIAFFYLKSINSHPLWYPSGFTGPKMWQGVLIMALFVASAAIQPMALQRIKDGKKALWQAGALAALVLGTAAVAFQIFELADVPFWPGSSGFAGVFVAYCPVYLTIAFCAMV